MRDQCCWDIWGTYMSSKFLLNKALPSAETSNRYTRAPMGTLLPVLLKTEAVPTVSKAGVCSSTFHPARPSFKAWQTNQQPVKKLALPTFLFREVINICNSFKITFLVQQLLKDRQLFQQHSQEMLPPASVKATLSLPSPAPHKKPLG